MFDEIMITLDLRSPFLAKHPVFIRIYVICTKFSMHTVPTDLGTGIHTSTSGYNCGIILGFSKTAFFGMGWHGLRLH
jgi:hypothetical protein